MKNVFNKIVQVIKKHDNIFVFTYFIIILSVYVYAIKLNIGDELWNFSFIYKMTNGYTIYKDLNVIITPLFHYIGKLIFLVFGSNYFNFRIYNVIICTSLYFSIYILFKNIKVNKKKSFVYTIIICIVTRITVTVGANYNVLVLVFVILGINLELIEGDHRIINIIKGINLFFIFMCKQNIFIYYSIALFIVYIIKIKQNKITIKQSICILISFIIPLILVVVYFNYNGIFEEFISYCFLGILEFSNKNKVINMDAIIYITVGMISIVLSFLLINLKAVNKNIKKNKLYNATIFDFIISYNLSNF